jgi:excisionase family DNA binding protein
MPIEPLYAVAEIARAWGVSKNYVYDLLANGELDSVDLGHGRAKTRVPESALDAYLKRLAEVKRRTRPRNIRSHLKAVA